MTRRIRHKLFSALGGVSLGILAALAVASSAQAAVFHPQSYRLANGLQVVVIQGALSPAVTQMVWYKVGAADDPAGRSGLAHYLEHLMFKATDTMQAGAFSATVAAQGGNDNAFTDHDATAYYVSMAADRLPLVMQMEADRMRHLRLTPEDALPERDVVLSERQQRTGNNPQGLFEEKMDAALFPGHPYGRPVIGWKKDIQSLDDETARHYYAQHYAPNNAVLVISGDVDPREVLRLAAGTFGRLSPTEGLSRAPVPPAPLPAEKRIEMRDARVKQAFVTHRIVAPSYTDGGKEPYALEVLAEALAGGEVGELYRRFVVEEGIASGVDVSYDPVMRGPSVFSLTLTPAPQVDPAVLERKVSAYLARLARQGLPASSVRAAQRRLQDSALFARDRLMAPAQVLGAALAAGQSVADVESWPERINAVTAAQVNAALRHLLRSPRQVTGILLPDAPGKENP